MEIIYRKDKVLIGPDWHFNEECQRWPDKHFIEAEILDPAEGDRICKDCIRLYLEGARKKPSNEN